MKQAAVAVAFLLFATPTFAQIGTITRGINKGLDAKDKYDKLAGMNDKEERQLGERVSAMLVDRFGVYQDPATTKYVALVGSVLAQASSRPNLQWEFIVLDTDGVNAFAAPGGFVHITRGALGLIKNEAELAGVLGHELTHITERHTVGAIDRASRLEVGTAMTSGYVPGSGWTAEALNYFARIGFNVAFFNSYDRKEELESDKIGIQVANKVGYAPNGMNAFLQKIATRNKDMKEPNGWFASHPLIKDRVEEMEKAIRKDKLTATATVQPRYAEKIALEAKPLDTIAIDVEGVRGAVGGTTEKKEEPKKEEPKKSGGGMFGGLSKLGGSKSQSSQTVASGGSRGGVPDRDAVGGPNKSKLKVPVTPAEVEAFKKGIAG